jgi:IS5 family transposase
MSSSYRLRNWSEYEHALEQRGSLSLLLPEDTLRAWSAVAGAAAPLRRARHRGQRGRPRLYSDAVITSLLKLQALFHLGDRETIGLARSLFALLHLEVRVPDHTTLARRRARLHLGLPISATRRPLHLVVDSTGLAVRGEGSWQLHRCGNAAGAARRLTWKCHYRRIHLAVDEATGELRALAVSSMNVTDGEMLPALLNAVTAPLAQVTADGGYDTWRCYDAVAAHPDRPRAVFPPPRVRTGPHRPRVRQHGNTAGPPLDRDAHIRRIRQVGRRRWKEECGYHRRSLAETLISRYKRLFGDRLTTHSFASQCTEVFLRGALLNRFLWLGRPDSYRVA